MVGIAPTGRFVLKTGTFFGLPVFGSIGPSSHFMRPVAGFFSNTAETALRIPSVFALKYLSTVLPLATSATITSFFGATTVDIFIEWTSGARALSAWFGSSPMP